LRCGLAFASSRRRDNQEELPLDEVMLEESPKEPTIDTGHEDEVDKEAGDDNVFDSQFWDVSGRARGTEEAIRDNNISVLVSFDLDDPSTRTYHNRSDELALW
jgi:hypothetical protein